MKRTLLLLCAAALLTACESSKNRSVNEPSGAEVTNAPPEQARDINQQPYPGTSPFDQQQRNITPRGPDGADTQDMNP